MKKEKFYKEGLYFECTGCGLCCSHPGGYVELTAAEVRQIADYLNISRAAFTERYLEPSQKNAAKYRLKSSEADACIFYKDPLCSIYPVRPLQCQTFPFWPENLKSVYRWKKLAEHCPGIGQGKFYTAGDILEILKSQKSVSKK